MDKTKKAALNMISVELNVLCTAHIKLSTKDFAFIFLLLLYVLLSSSFLLHKIKNLYLFQMHSQKNLTS